MNICIIIPSYNLIDKLKKCLDHILDTGYEDLEVIIFDNGSLPSIKQGLKTYQNKIKNLIFIRESKNIGYVQANNRSLAFGLKRFKKIDYFLLLNNDAYLTKDFFHKSLKYLHQDYDLLSPLVLLTKNRGFDSRGIDYYGDGTGVNRVDDKKGPYLLPAACLFISRKYVENCFDNFGWLFIPDFESYAEDIEFSLRTYLLQKKMILIPIGLVHHDRSSTIRNQNKVDFLSMRNQLWTIITTWTDDMIKNHIFEIVKGQINNNFVATLKFKNIFMFRIYLNTIFALPGLLKIRNIFQKNILPNGHEDIFSKKKPATFLNIIKTSRTYKKLILFFRFLVKNRL